MNLHRFVILPGGGSSYNRKGVISPVVREIDLAAIISNKGGKQIEWTKNFSWIKNHDNDLVTFYSEWGTVAALTCILYKYPLLIANVWTHYFGFCRSSKMNDQQALRALPFLLRKRDKK